MLSVVFTASVFEASAQRPSVDVPCAKDAQLIPSEELMRLAVRKTPVIPPSMDRLPLHGTVTLKVCVNSKGKVFAATVIDGHPMARQAVLEAVEKWQFKPYRRNGRSKDVVGDLGVDYDFRSPPQAAEDQK